MMQEGHKPKPALKILLAAPRGFCAGVDRAIQIVEKALEKHGAPVYVRHEIVHNRHVVEDLRAKGAVFVEELDEIPDTDAPVIFSAHGVPKSVPDAARLRNLHYIDATCPLVSKVHHEALHHHARGLSIILIGHAGHPEVIGTMGQLPAGAVHLVETTQDVLTLNLADEKKCAYVTQTTLSVDDTAEIVEALKKKFPRIKGPKKEDICYATTNRQAAIRSVADGADAVLVVGAPNSSNSRRLVEVAQRAGCPKAQLIQSVDDLEAEWMSGVRVLGITAGASAPEILVRQVIDYLKQRYEVQTQELTLTREDVSFNLPRELVRDKTKQAS